MNSEIRWSERRGHYVVQQGRSQKIYWDGQMLSDLRCLYATTLNEDLAQILRVSQSTMVRKARELGLRKDPRWLKDIYRERALLAITAWKKKGREKTNNNGKD